MPGFKIKEQVGYNLSVAEKEVLEAITVLGDPGADRILFWDESENTYKYLTAGSGLTITGTTMTAEGTGDVVGPASATDHAIARFDLTTGKLIQDSSVTIDDNGSINIPTGQSYKINNTALAYTNITNALGSAAVLTNDYITRGDGGVRGMQTSLAQLSDAGTITLPNVQSYKFLDYAGTGTLNVLTGTVDDEVNVGVQLNIGSMELEEDAGVVTLVDMPVSSSSADGTEMSYTFKLGGYNVLKVYSEADGAGGTDSFAVKLLNSAGLDITETAATTDTDKFLVSDSGRVKYRTGAEVLSDIGGQASLGYTAENTDNKVTSFQSTPDNTHYASEKLVKDSLNAKQDTMTKAIGSDIDTGTDDDKYVTSKSLGESGYNKLGGITTSSASPTPYFGRRVNEYFVTALAVDATFASPEMSFTGGALRDGDSLLIRIKDNGTARALSWNAIYRVIGTTLPTTTVANKTIYIGCKYNSGASKWDVLAVGQEAA